MTQLRTLAGLALLACFSSQVRAATIGEQPTAPIVDGYVSGGEYGLGGPLATAGGGGFGPFNRLGELYVSWSGGSIAIGLRGATLETNNALVLFVASEGLTDGVLNPAASTDQGEPGDSGTPAHAESVLTRANRDLAWEPFSMPMPVHLGLGMVDRGYDQSQTGFPSSRDDIGLYRLYASDVNNLHFRSASIAWRDAGGAGDAGLEVAFALSELGIGPGGTFRLGAAVTSLSGYLSNETLPAGALGGSNPGFGAATFGAFVDVTLAAPPPPGVPEPSGAGLALASLLALARISRLRRAR